MQLSNKTISWISIDLIAKLSPRIQCISVIVPFGFYRIECMILSIDWILSMNHSIDYLSLINCKMRIILIMSNGWIIIINLILIDRSYPIILFMINNTKEINAIQYDYKTYEYYGWIIMNRYRKLTKYTPQNRLVDSTAFLF